MSDLLELFIRDFYLQNGLIPVEGFSSDEIRSFHEKLNSLPSEERRKVTRKFRKFVRKIEKAKHGNSAIFFDAQDSSIQEKRFRRDRRRLVHHHIRQTLFEKLHG